jgi:hypothetical protein
LDDRAVEISLQMLPLSHWQNRDLLLHEFECLNVWILSMDLRWTRIAVHVLVA